MKWLTICCLLALAASTLTEETKGEEERKLYEPNKQKFLLGVVRTKVISIGSTTTITVAATTCHNGVPSGSTCSGRKKRLAIPELPAVNPGGIQENINSSMNEGVYDADVDREETNVQKLVIWSTSTTTLTFTSSSTASGTTLSVSYYCTASAMSIPPSCG